MQLRKLACMPIVCVEQVKLLQGRKTGLLFFGVRLQETRHNMAEYFCLVSTVIMPSLGSYGQYVIFLIHPPTKITSSVVMNGYVSVKKMHM